VPWGIGIVLITTVTGIALNLLHQAWSVDEIMDMPLLATMFVAVVWHANRRIVAEAERRRFGEKNARLLTAQRRPLQDASHHLRTPITIALAYAELLARDRAAPAASPGCHRCRPWPPSGRKCQVNRCLVSSLSLPRLIFARIGTDHSRS
jgi:signal transduction histidine kinase